MSPPHQDQRCLQIQLFSSPVLKELMDKISLECQVSTSYFRIFRFWRCVSHTVFDLISAHFPISAQYDNV